jgi:putative tricarboxylic transport membrane protein
MWRDLTCSLLLLSIAIGYYFAASDLGQTALSDAVGPAGLPRAYAIGLALLAAAIGLAGWLRHRPFNRARPAEAGPEVDPGSDGLKGSDESGGEAKDVSRRSRDASNGSSNDPGTSRRLARGAGVVAIGIAYLVVVPIVGYPIAMALMIGTMAVYQGERPTLRVLLVALAGAAMLFLLFDVVLGVALPAPWAD